MKINWFPGHMTKSFRMMQDEVKNIDIVIYLLDARAPMSCLNPKFEKLISNKIVLYVLNKSDLADELKTEKFINKMQSENKQVVKLDSSNGSSGNYIIQLLKNISFKKGEKFLQKGIKIMPKIMVIGVPNVGKSTLINNMTKKAKAKTGNKPGVTRGKQVVMLDNGMQLIDTPGTLWPSFEKEKIGINLALVGSIKDEVLDINELAYELVFYLKENYKQKLEQRYNLSILNEDMAQIIEMIANNRGYVIKGGEIDYDRTCVMLVNEFRKGLIGKISLE